MRALLFATLAAAAVIGLAGCGQDAAAPASDTSTNTTGTETTETLPPVSKPTKPAEPEPPRGTPKPPVSQGPTGLVVPDGVTQVPAAQVDSSAVPVYSEHSGQVWMFDDGHSLQLFATATSSCTDAEAVVVDQSDAEVRIMLRPLPSPPGGLPDGGACGAVMTPKPVVVTLDAPLGDRMIYLAGGR
ncbi:MAG TPA: hypothetical protein VNP92_22750 [Actinophytocola sp.]|nr:hypothetical protein [Actinophytocola sp.]